jgi:hypothetical protein
MTSDRPTGDATRPDAADAADAADAEDWWGGPVPPSADPSPAAAGQSGSGDARGSVGRSRWLLAAVAAAVVVAVGIGALVTRDDGGSDVATGGNSTDPGGRGGPGGPGGFGGGTGGVIAELDADTSTLVVETSEGETVEVTATEDTTISETVEGSADDLAVGDSILVVGSEPDDGTIAAEQVVAGGDGELLGGARPPGGGAPEGGDMPEPPEGGFPDGAPSGGGEPGQGGGPGGFTTGTIASIGDGSVSVQTTDDETVTVTLSSSTTVLLSHALSFGDLAPGDEITVTGQGEDDDATMEAVVIRRGDGGFGFGGGMPPSGGNGSDGDGSDAGAGSST